MTSWYKKNEKYQVTETIETYTDVRGFDVPIVQGNCIVGHLARDGLLTLFPGFGCDGASGPTVDSPQNMKAANFHDALYFLIEEGRLPVQCQLLADQLLRRLMLPSPAHTLLGHLLYLPRVARALYYYSAVRLFGRMFMKKRKKFRAGLISLLLIAVSLVVSGCVETSPPKFTSDETGCFAKWEAWTDAEIAKCELAGKGTEGECSTKSIIGKQREEMHRCVDEH